MNKVMVVITDGDNQMLVRWVTDHWESPYNTYENPANLGVTPTGATQATNATLAELNQRTTDVCNAVKAAGITIYAITFSASVSAGGQTLMRGCASTSNHYWHAPTNATLRTAFQAIGSQLNNLRVKR